MGLEFFGGKPMCRVWGCCEPVENGVKAKDTSALFELDMAARVAVAVWYVDSQGGRYVTARVTGRPGRNTQTGS